MLKRSALALLAVALLPSCRSGPAPLQALFHPAQQVRHGGNDAASSYYRLGRYHQQRGELDQAITAYNYAIARAPRAALPRMAAAVIHAQQGRLAQARAMLLAVCADHPTLVQPLNNLGYVYYLQGEYGAASAAFRSALNLQPGNEHALNNLRLAEGAGLRGTAPAATLAAASPVSVQPPAPREAPSAVPARESEGLQLVRSAPNVYELRQARASSAAPELAPASPAAGKDARLEIANGNGVPGLARRFRDALALQGLKAHRLTNARPFGQPRTRIEFRPGFEAAAQGLQLALGGKAVLERKGPTAPADLRLLLGKDADLAPVLAAGATPRGTLLTAAAPATSK